MRFACLAAALACAAACGGGSHSGPPDSGPHEDGGSHEDGGPLPDAGSPPGACQTIPSRWTRSPERAGGTAVFTEIMFQPVAGAPAWIEIHNLLSIDMDLSGWRLAGDVTSTFPEGTFLAPDGYLVVASDPGALAGALGPTAGALPREGGTLDLRSNSNRLMDRVSWTVDVPWPVTAAGSGASLAKTAPAGASELAESWRGSAEPGGTPGADNFPDPLAPPEWVALVPPHAAFRVDASGAAPPDDWNAIGFDDSEWAEGTADLYSGWLPPEEQTVTARFAADNFFAVYTGNADGADLELVGRDDDGDWSSAEDFSFSVDADDHLYVAAWEDPADDGGPQMVIGEAVVPGGVVGTSAAHTEWMLGPVGGAPGDWLGDPPPDVASLANLVAEGDWAAPAVEADRLSDPWGWALGAQLSDAAHYVWSDTFDDVSQSNVDRTYVLFRTVSPLIGPPGETDVGATPITTYFRHELLLPAEPERLSVWLSTRTDDGAVVYVNGTEVLRVDMPDGPVGPNTFAEAAVDGPVSSEGIEIPSSLLVDGVNVLSAEVHRAAPGGGQMIFGAELGAHLWPAARTEPGVHLSEVSAGGAGFWLEVGNAGSGLVETEGMVVATSEGAEAVLPAGELGPGDVAQFAPGLTAEVGDALFLYSAGKGAVLDGVRIRSDAQSREGADWFVPDESTPGTLNAPFARPTVVINEVMYHHAGSDEEWIELHNVGAEPVELGGWSLVDAVSFDFPAETILPAGGFLVVARRAADVAATHPGIAVIGDFRGRLDNSGARVVLRDDCANVVDEVRYADGGRWPRWADGGGASLELRDPRADNAVAEAWGASVLPGGDWTDVTVEDVVSGSAVGPDGAWQELVLGLLDAGEVMVDDVSLVEDPGGAALERMQNGSFERGAASWRLLGNHRHSEVIEDPTAPGNHVLRLVATGPTEHMHNHAETTLANGATIRDGVRYRLGLRARWVAGSGQLNSRLYFNRLAATTVLPRSPGGGTCGARNSVLVDDLGPTYTGFGHTPVVPVPGEPVTVSVSAADPDGVAGLILHYRVDGGANEFAAMSLLEGRFVAQIPGARTGTVIQFWVEGIDETGAVSTFPAAGAASRALVRVGPAERRPMHTLSVLLAPEDEAWLFTPENLMSNDLIAATVIWNDRQAFYDVGVHLKGSERGRPVSARVGYAIKFRPDDLFQGVYRSVMIDRSEGIGFGQREMLVNLAIAHAGSVHSQYSDLIWLDSTRPELTGPAELQLTRFEDRLLGFQFEDGQDGPLYEYEYIYYPVTTTDGRPESPKVPEPDNVVGTGIQSLGDDPEAYRWVFILKNQREQDDWEDLIGFCEAFGSDASSVIDVDEWLRAFAFATLSGAVDQYGAGDGHNAMLYVRASDRKVLYFPKDLDFFGWPYAAIVQHPDLARLISDPANARAFYRHLLEILQTSYNGDYLAHFAAQLGALLPEQDFAGHVRFVVDRAQWALDGAPDSVLQAVPQVPFAITTNGGASLVTTSSDLTLAGQAWVDVATIERAGAAGALPLSWVGTVDWRTDISLECGANDVDLEARDSGGTVIATDSIAVTRSGGACP